MKTCRGCKWAVWQKTAAGKLHQSGNGRCTYPWKMPAIPASMYWMGTTPSPNGGYISRKDELKDRCTYFSRSEP